MVTWKGYRLTRYAENCFDLYNLLPNGDLKIKTEGLLEMWKLGRAIYKDNERRGNL